MRHLRGSTVVASLQAVPRVPIAPGVLPLPIPIALLAAAMLSACAPESTPVPAPDGLDLLFSAQVAVVDLTHAIGPSSPFWPGSAETPFSYDILAAHPDGTPVMGAYHVPEHFGTHLDAPIHGGQGLLTSDAIPVDRFFAPAVILDVTEKAAANPDYAATEEDALQWEALHGRIPDGAVVIVRSGWARRWDQGDTYYNRGEDGALHFPGFAVSLARFLIDERDINGIGLDSGSVDPGNASGFPVHSIVNGAGKYHLENLADLSSLPEVGAGLIVAPIKIEGGSGGQVRVYAVLPTTQFP